MSTHIELTLWKLVSRIDRRAETSLFSDRQVAERERQYLHAAYGACATTRLTPIRVMRQAEVVR